MDRIRLWRHICERERIRLRRESGAPWPWTSDPILQRYRFTNVRREHDRTTQAFLAVYRDHRREVPGVALYNCAVRRFTGTVAAGSALGWFSEHDPRRIQRAERACDQIHATFWTGAYMVRGGAAGVPKWRAVCDYLGPIWVNRQAITRVIEAQQRWEAGYLLMHQLYGLGGNGFMAKEVLQDYLLWRREAGHPPLRDEETWTPMGPGARRGLNRLAGRGLWESVPDAQMLREVLDLRSFCQPRWLREFRGATPLTAHDIQFQLCEVDKYLRVERGEGRPRATYRRPQ